MRRDHGPTIDRPLRRLAAILVGTVAAAALMSGCSSGASAPEPAFGEGGEPAPEVAPGAAPMEGGEKGSASGPVDEALVIKTGSLDLEVDDFDAALAKARTTITGLGGYVSGSEMYLEGDQPYGFVTYRIPSDRWDDGVTSLKSLATKVTGEQIQAVDVTKSVVDLEARLKNLRATEAQLLAIMTQATKISDILEVQQQLTSVRGEIEQLVAEREHLRDQTAYGTLTAHWQTPFAAVHQAQAAWEPARTVDDAVAQLMQLGQGLMSFAIWFVIVGLPVLVVGGLLVLAVVLLGRRARRFRRPPTTPTTPGTPATSDTLATPTTTPAEDSAPA